MLIAILVLLILQILILFIFGVLIMSAVSSLEENVAANTSGVDSVVQLLTNLKAKLDEAIASGNMGRVQELSDEIGNNNSRLAAAVVANTPAA